MGPIDTVITTNAVFSNMLAEALVSKGIISKSDLRDALTTLCYEAPVPQEVHDQIQYQITALHEPE